MKKTILILFVLSSIMTSCKYKEGPAISFRSAKNRIYGYYNLTSITVDGVEHLTEYSDSLSKRFDFHESVGSFDKPVDVCHIQDLSGHGTIWNTWILADHNKILKTTSVAPEPIDASYGPFKTNVLPEWEILRLTSGDMKFKTIYLGKEYVITLNGI